MPVPVRFYWEIEALGDGCLFTIGSEYDAPASAVRTVPEVQAWREPVSESLIRLRRLLDEKAQAPAARG